MRDTGRSCVGQPQAPRPPWRPPRRRRSDRRRPSTRARLSTNIWWSSMSSDRHDRRRCASAIDRRSRQPRRTVVPDPAVDSICTLAAEACAATRSTMVSPRPLACPLGRVENRGSTLARRTSGGMPMPGVGHADLDRRADRVDASGARSVTTPPSGIASHALSTRWRSAISSPLRLAMRGEGLLGEVELEVAALAERLGEHAAGRRGRARSPSTGCGVERAALAEVVELAVEAGRPLGRHAAPARAARGSPGPRPAATRARGSW